MLLRWIFTEAEELVFRSFYADDRDESSQVEKTERRGEGEVFDVAF